MCIHRPKQRLPLSAVQQFRFECTALQKLYWMLTVRRRETLNSLTRSNCHWDSLNVLWSFSTKELHTEYDLGSCSKASGANVVISQPPRTSPTVCMSLLCLKLPVIMLLDRPAMSVKDLILQFHHTGHQFCVDLNVVNLLASNETSNCRASLELNIIPQVP